MGSSLYKNKPEFKGPETAIGVCTQQDARVWTRFSNIRLSLAYNPLTGHSLHTIALTPSSVSLPDSKI